MRPPIFLQTKFGSSLYEIVLSQYNESLQKDSIAEYKKVLFREKMKVSRQLSEFIYSDEQQRKYPMEDDDTEGWKIFKELSDKYAVLNYFEARKS